MASDVNPIPDGFTAITPHIVVDGAEAAMDFYKRAFGAEEVLRMPGPEDQGLMHAEIRIGGARLMLVDAFPQWGMKSPKDLGGTPCTIPSMSRTPTPRSHAPWTRGRRR